MELSTRELRFGRHRNQHLWRGCRRCLRRGHTAGQENPGRGAEFSGPIGQSTATAVSTPPWQWRFCQLHVALYGNRRTQCFRVKADGKILITGSGLVGRYTSTGRQPRLWHQRHRPFERCGCNRNGCATQWPDPDNFTGSGAPSLISVGAGVSFNFTPLHRLVQLHATTLTGVWIRRLESRDKQPALRRRPASQFKASWQNRCRQHHHQRTP